MYQRQPDLGETDLPIVKDGRQRQEDGLFGNVTEAFQSPALNLYRLLLRTFT